MGLFDKLIEKGSKVISEVASEENKEKASEFFGNLKKGIDDVAAEVTSEENKEKAAAFFGNLKAGINDAAESIREAVDNAGLKPEEGVRTEAGPDGSAPAGDYFRTFEAAPFASAPKPAAEAAAAAGADAGDSEANTPALCRARILSVLAQDFPQYTVKEEVSPATIGGTGHFMDYSIGIYDGDAPKLFIMIIGKTTTSHRGYRWAREVAEKAGVTFINFIGHYPNHTAYIRERLAKYL